MPAKLTTLTDRRRLTPTEQKVAALIAAGSTPRQAAETLGVSRPTVTDHLNRIGWKTHTTSHAARIHVVLANGQIDPPMMERPAPDFTSAELQLLRALAERSETVGIAAASGVPLANVRPALRSLRERAGASTDAHLVGLGHAWGLLGPANQSGTAADTDASSHQS
ncbi:LuxR C-terminal-related transcriptional regulator [Streptomyces sp. HK10]|uniref:LuxR C-terminal-related transcriptional regulator n=1 Tax=Streptomyces sp. HK10 TaxID=3373255 RepID=UPI003748530B